MNNEQYLIISYFLIGIICFIIALAVYLFLRGSFVKIVSRISGKHHSTMLKKLFFPGIILPALAGFFSVSFKSCTVQTYQEVIRDRIYLIERNQAQVSSSLSYIVYALMIWSIIIFISVIVIRKQRSKAHNN